jgi:hypothetical protein
MALDSSRAACCSACTMPAAAIVTQTIPCEIQMEGDRPDDSCQFPSQHLDPAREWGQHRWNRAVVALYSSARLSGARRSPPQAASSRTPATSISVAPALTNRIGPRTATLTFRAIHKRLHHMARRPPSTVH